MLFDQLHEDAVAVVNANDDWSKRMVQNCHARVITFDLTGDADYRARDIAITSNASNFVLVTPDGRAEVSMGLIGRHNIENALCAAALVGETLGLTLHHIAPAIHAE